jgi:hypothetical protein
LISWNLEVMEEDSKDRERSRQEHKK